MAQTISHEGCVIKITETTIEVKVSKQEACGSCRAKELCGNGSERIIVVPIGDNTEFKIGQQVLVTMDEVLVLTVLLILLQLNAGELTSGLAALGCGAIYFLVLSMFRKKFRKKIIFTAYPID